MGHRTAVEKLERHFVSFPMEKSLRQSRIKKCNIKKIGCDIKYLYRYHKSWQEKHSRLVVGNTQTGLYV